MKLVTVDPEAITPLIAAILRADGCTPEEADTVAGHLVDASLTGHDSHGVIRVPRYHDWLASGQINGSRELKTLVDLGSLVQLDGQSGMGQWLALEATALGIARARTHGVALIAMRRAGHIGRLGAFAEEAASAGIVSIQFCNVAGSCLVAPFGAASRAISTAPVAIGVPDPAGDFILDFATARVAEGKALVAAQGGAALPPDALIDADGRPTSDPLALYGETLEAAVPNPRAGPGALAPMGAHKGSGLALACELLAGALTGTGTNGPNDHAFGNGWVGVFLDPSRLDTPSAIAAEVSDYIAHVRGLPPAEGVEKVLVPGDPERRRRAARRRDGFLLGARPFERILEIAGELGIPADRAKLERASAGVTTP